MQGNRKNPVDLTGFLRSYPALRAGLVVFVMAAALGAFAWGIRAGLSLGSNAPNPAPGSSTAASQAPGTSVQPSQASKATPVTSPAPAQTAQPTQTSQLAQAAKPTQAAQPSPASQPAKAPQKPAAAAGVSAAPGKGAAAQSGQQLVWPYQGGIVKAFGWAYSGTHEDWRFHQGIDIAADEGDEVVAAMGGRIASVEETGLYGVRITVEHPGKLKTVYACLGGALVKTGDTVKAGDPIATVGRAAFEWTDPVHIHFETVSESGPVDPAKYLK